MNQDLVFISHTSADGPLANALGELFEGYLPRIDIAASTSYLDGPQGGENWRTWIHETIRDANTVVVIVTPQAIGKPWLLWEAGAAAGVGIARSERGDSPAEIVTLLYGVGPGACPDPLRGEQVVDGTNVEEVWNVIRRLVRTRHGADDEEVETAIGNKADLLGTYTAAMDRSVFEKASLPTEANVQDWLLRLDELVDSADLAGELPGFIRWLRLAFGLDDADTTSTIDVRIHRKLGSLLLDLRDFPGAISEFELARRAAPRDVYVLRPLGEAYLKHYLENQADIGDDDAMAANIEVLLAMIEGIDEGAFVYQPDAAALRAKYFRKARHQPEKAAEVLSRALAANGDSTYLADVLGQVQLELGRIDEARASFAHALALVTAKPEMGIWDHATAASAHLVLADGRVDESIRGVVGCEPSANEAKAVADGLREIAAQLGVVEEAERLVVPLIERPDVA